jgi:hypothetical protein
MFEMDCSCRLYSASKVLYSCRTCCILYNGLVAIGMVGFILVYRRCYMLCQIIIYVFINMYYQFSRV